MSMAILAPEHAPKPIDIGLVKVSEHKDVNRAAWITVTMFQFESSCTSENVEAAMVPHQSKEQGSLICWV
jgi:hypothetical protein